MIVKEPQWQTLKIFPCFVNSSSNANIKMINNYGYLYLGPHPKEISSSIRLSFFAMEKLYKRRANIALVESDFIKHPPSMDSNQHINNEGPYSFSY
jgi:hypothetical protein